MVGKCAPELVARKPLHGGRTYFIGSVNPLISSLDLR
jgi:hypothetical protein